MLNNLIYSLRFDRPRWLYESAPYLYLTVGILVLIRLTGPLAGVSSAMLILAGIHVLAMRWSHRRTRTEDADVGPVPLPIILDSSCHCEHEVIDAEHRELFLAAHTVVKAANKGDPDDIKTLVGYLINRIRRHFEVEEGVLMQADPAIARQQAAEHEALARKMTALHQSFLAGRIEPHELIECVVYEAIVEHTKQDKAIFAKAFWGEAG